MLSSVTGGTSSRTNLNIDTAAIKKENGKIQAPQPNSSLFFPEGDSPDINDDMTVNISAISSPMKKLG